MLYNVNILILGVPLPKRSGRAVRSRFPMKNRESSTAIPHANVPKENELFTIRIIAKKGRCKALQTLRAALIFLFLQGFQNLVGLFLEFKYLQGQKKTLQEIVTILLIFK